MSQYRYNNILAYIKKRRIDNSNLCLGLYTVRGLVIASAQAVARNIGFFIYDNLQKKLSVRLRETKGDENKKHIKKLITKVKRSKSLPKAITGAFINAMKKYTQGRSETENEDFYSMIFDIIIQGSVEGAERIFPKSFMNWLFSKAKGETRDMPELVSNFKHRFHGIARDTMLLTKTEKKFVIHPESEQEDEADERYWETISEEQTRQPVRKKPNVFEQVKDVWQDVEKRLNAEKKQLVNWFVREFSVVFPKSSLAGYDEELERITRKSKAAVKKEWVVLIDKIAKVIDQKIIRQRGFNYKNLESQIFKLLPEDKNARTQAAYIKNQLAIVIVDLARDNLRDIEPDAVFAIDAYFKGTIGKYQNVVKKIERTRLEEIEDEIEEEKFQREKLRRKSPRRGSVEDLYVDPEQMVIELLQKRQKTKKADSNRDDLEKYVMHLLNETTEEEAPIGKWNNMRWVDNRMNTIVRNITVPHLNGIQPRIPRKQNTKKN